MGKRAAIACLNCRAQKVRCNVQDIGAPCQTCAADGVRCCVRGRKRGRPSRDDASSGAQAREALGMVTQPTKPPSANYEFPPEPVHTLQWLPSDEPTSLKNGKSEVPTRASTGLYEKGESSSCQSSSILNVDTLHHELSYTALISRDERQINEITTPQYESQSLLLSPEALPKFIRPLPATLTSIDKEYLQARGAFRIPPPDLRREIIDHYLRYVHPYLPLLCASRLRRVIEYPQSTGDAPFGLLLFQAVMFSAVHLLQVKELRRLGFHTARDARRAFYERVRLLYDFDIEPDRLCVIQCLILMSLWSESPGDSKGGWHWIGVSVSLALTLGLHRSADYAALDPQESRLRRRIWWSCYVRDRVLALASNRLWRIRDGEFDVPMLALEDFKPGDSNADNTTKSPTSEEERESQTAQLFIGLSQLCTLVCGILDLHFSILPESNTTAQSNDSTGTTSTLFFARINPPSLDRIHEYDQKLQTWFQNRPPICIYQPVGSDSNILFAGFLNMIFFAITSALHRPLLRQHVLTDFDEYRRLSQRRVKTAATEMAKISRGLHDIQLARYAPFATCMLVIPAIIVFSEEIGSYDTESIHRCLRLIMACFEMVHDIKETYMTADIIMSFCLDVVTRSNILARMDEGSAKVTALSYGSVVYDLANSLLDLDRHNISKSLSDKLEASSAQEIALSGIEIEEFLDHEARMTDVPYSDAHTSSNGAALPNSFSYEACSPLSNIESVSCLDVPSTWI